MPHLLTTASTLLCPHGGRVQATTSNTIATAPDASAFVLVESDVHAVVGCPFVLPGPKPSPCVRVEWTGGSATCDVDGVPALTAASVGQCKSPEGAPQGAAVVVATQTVVADH